MSFLITSIFFFLATLAFILQLWNRSSANSSYSGLLGSQKMRNIFFNNCVPLGGVQHVVGSTPKNFKTEPTPLNNNFGSLPMSMPNL